MEVIPEYTDLAPTIIRRRLIIEGILKSKLTKDLIESYMFQLSKIMDMTIVSKPVFNYDEKYGLSSYMCWKESGMHIYTWTKTDQRPDFFSIDIYTCKDFTIEDVINHTLKSFPTESLTWKK